MTALNNNLDSSLKSWEEIKGQFQKAELLVGNGLSCAVWDKFKYPSLYEKSVSNSNHPLSKLDIQLFKDWGADGNFEKVLSNLLIAKRTNEIIGQSNDSEVQTVIRERYTNIRNALISAVSEVHISSRDIHQNPNVLNSIQEELKNYSCVYSTNYDLLIYWAIMSNPESFQDCFWGREFDITNTGTSKNLTRILHIHGAIHLYREMGRTKKLTYQPRQGQSQKQTILDKFRDLWDIEKSVTPLFIAEGNSKEKLESIYRHDYLSFAYSEFKQPKESLVVFGHSLGKSDQHLVDAIKAAKIPQIAISIHTPSRDRMENLVKIFKSSHLLFFEAQSHPLGNPSLKVAVEE